jgi:hypothetical protein
MAYDLSMVVITLPAHADYTAKQYRFMSVNSSGRAQTTGDGARADGVLQGKPNAQDQAADVCVAGISKVFSGGSFTAGDLLAADTNGDAVAAASGDAVLGVALENGADNQLVSVLLKLQGVPTIA